MEQARTEREGERRQGQGGKGRDKEGQGGTKRSAPDEGGQTVGQHRQLQAQG